LKQLNIYHIDQDFFSHSQQIYEQFYYVASIFDPELESPSSHDTRI